MRSFNLIRSGHEPHRAGGQAPWLRGDRLDAPHYAAHLFYRLRSISGRGAFISAALAPQCLTAIHATPQTLVGRSEEHTSELQSLMRRSYAHFCMIKHTHTTLSIGRRTCRSSHFKA